MPELKLDDETRKIFLCAGGTADDVSDDMKDFLDWLIGKQGKSELVKALDNAVQKARNHEEWRLEYMTLLMRDQEMIRRGRLQEIFCVGTGRRLFDRKSSTESWYGYPEF